MAVAKRAKQPKILAKPVSNPRFDLITGAGMTEALFTFLPV